MSTKTDNHYFNSIFKSAKSACQPMNSGGFYTATGDARKPFIQHLYVLSLSPRSK